MTAPAGAVNLDANKIINKINKLHHIDFIDYFISI